MENVLDITLLVKMEGVFIPHFTAITSGTVQTEVTNNIAVNIENCFNL